MSKCKLKYGGEESEEFEVRTGLRRGDALSPALFNIALESAMRETLDGATGIKIGNDQQLYSGRIRRRCNNNIGKRGRP